MGKIFFFFMSISFYLWSFTTTPFVFFCMKKAHRFGCAISFSMKNWRMMQESNLHEIVLGRFSKLLRYRYVNHPWSE